jgi:hypothetical protein
MGQQSSQLWYAASCGMQRLGLEMYRVVSSATSHAAVLWVSVIWRLRKPFTLP